MKRASADLSTPMIFAGPTIPKKDILEIVPRAMVMRPISRGDLISFRNYGHSLFLIIDGTFSHGFAISPGEIVDVVQSGATILGASSIGAIRAAECYPSGVHGVGKIYHMYRNREISNDDEVIVMTDPETREAVTEALVNVRYAASEAEKAQLISPEQGKLIVSAAKHEHFSSRTWKNILSIAEVEDPDGKLLNFCSEVNLKRLDAMEALMEIGVMAQSHEPNPFTQEVKERSRYSGHDRFLGLSEERFTECFTQWLVGSGRYRRYVWPLVIGEPEFSEIDHASESERPEIIRERLNAVLARMLKQPEQFAKRMKKELDFLDELDTEIQVWNAHINTPLRNDGIGTPRAREITAIRQGYDSWSSLEKDIQENKLFGAIPVEWIQEAVTLQRRSRM